MFAAAMLALPVGASGCGGERLEPYAEAVLTVHTDMPVPRMVGVLQVDLYDELGWFESRVIPTPESTTWPLSFSLVSRNLDRGARVLVRLRGYPSRHVRDYRGELYEQPVFYPPRVPASLDDICADSVLETPPATFKLRQGSLALTQPQAQAGCESEVDAVNGRRVRIERPGSYRFEVLETYPKFGSSPPADTTLFLRASCQTPSSQLACNHGAAGGLARFEADLAPGEYTLFLGSAKEDPANIDYRIRVAPTDDWVALPAEVEPRLLVDGVDRTPSTEPQPAVTIDRLLDVRLKPGQVQRLSVVLRGDCVGTMARLFTGAARERIDAQQARTCVDHEGVLVPVEQAPIDDGPVTEPLGGTFTPPTGCERTSVAADAVCVPSDVLLLGDPRSAGFLPARNTVPERVARVGRFWLDRHEVTVGDYRAALRDGLALPSHDDLARNNGPLADSSSGLSDTASMPLCTWSDEPFDPPREDHAITCIAWQAARDYCQFRGGDLPTEVQWEHAATLAGRDQEVSYPWEEADPGPPSCDRAWFGHFGNVDFQSSGSLVWPELGTAYSGECRHPGAGGEFGPAPVGRVPGDVTPLGIQDMAGGVSEWVLDAAYPYADECWRGAPLDDPGCFVEAAPARGVRGGSWVHGAAWLTGASRGFRNEGTRPAAYLGFRCAYSDRAEAP